MPGYNNRTRYSSNRTNNNRRPSYGGSRSHTNKKPNRGQYIDPARFVKVAHPVTQEEYNATNRFDDFDIHPKLKANLTSNGYIDPTPVQDQTIPHALRGQDVIGIAHTGTGKTAAFAVPIINKLVAIPGSRALIIAPTRELAEQIEAELRKLATGSGIFGTVLIGGTSINRQISDLRRNPQVVIGTPGRIKDHVERRTLNLASFNIIVLDEVDRMLDMGFVDEVRAIFDQISPDRQSMFFSATLDVPVRNLISTFSKDPVTIMLKTSDSNDNVHQDVVRYSGPTDKMDKLHDTLIKDGVSKVIIFNETKWSTERLGKELVTRGFKAESIHGGKSQGQRQRALDNFKQNRVNVLVATDVAARGIDVADITHVINYSLPQTYDAYVHRIGRAGRAGKTGHALTFIEG
jgi:ATP-dependent RNA helicase RhlE